MKAPLSYYVVILVIMSTIIITCFAMQSASSTVEQLIARAQTMADASKSNVEQAKKDSDQVVAALLELQNTLTVPPADAIKFSLTKQYEIITLVTLQGNRLAHMMSQNEEVTLYRQQITAQGTPEQVAQLNTLYNSLQTNTVILAGDIEKNLLVIQQMIVLVIDILQQQPAGYKTLIAPLLEAEKNIGLLLSQKNVGHAQHAAFLAIKIGELIIDQKINPKEALTQAQKIVDEIKKLLPPPPVPPQPNDDETPDKDTSITTTIPTPIKPSPPTIAPGKAGESIQKANNKLSSAIRRIETVKKYYPDMDREEKNVIKKKAIGILKEYESGISSFTQKIQQVKHEAGNQLDETKLAPFNTFLELVNKLSNSINGL